MLGIAGHRISYERGLSLSIVWWLGLVFLKSVRLYASLVERLGELSEYLLHWSVREFSKSWNPDASFHYAVNWVFEFRMCYGKTL